MKQQKSKPPVQLHSEKTLPDLVEEALKKKLTRTDLDTLSLDTLVSLLHISSEGHSVFQEKKKCTCTVLEVDNDKKKAKGWQCQCHKVRGQKMCSFKGPKMTLWAPGIGGGQEGGHSWHWVTDPTTGENFKVEFDCKCD